ncbi:hypothetical protein GGI43DRAFT_388272 [Trichoderma evansii]
MAVLAPRLSLAAAPVIGRGYDPSARNRPAPPYPSANAAADSRHKATSSEFSSACGCRSSANHTPRSRRILAVAPHCTATVSPASGQA